MVLMRRITTVLLLPLKNSPIASIFCSHTQEERGRSLWPKHHYYYSKKLQWLAKKKKANHTQFGLSHFSYSLQMTSCIGVSKLGHIKHPPPSATLFSLIIYSIYPKFDEEYLRICIQNLCDVYLKKVSHYLMINDEQ